uniref:Putative secreted protein n=1 Tax=Anopheles darlingi TaxID=43151 RepID=A0A2M4D9H8_ANODA
MTYIFCLAIVALVHGGKKVPQKLQERFARALSIRMIVKIRFVTHSNTKKHILADHVHAIQRIKDDRSLLVICLLLFDTSTDTHCATWLRGFYFYYHYQCVQQN